MQELIEILNECREPDWDGYGARPVAVASCESARRFVEMLPLGIEQPSAGAEPDGEVTLEWHRSSDCTLSLSFTADGRIHYAALIGSACKNGTADFGGSIPAEILVLIRDVCGG
jgi:hypothetical protein